MLDLLHPKPTVVELHIKGKLDLSSFNPHGISLYEAGDVSKKPTCATISFRVEQARSVTQALVNSGVLLQATHNSIQTPPLVKATVKTKEIK